MIETDPLQTLLARSQCLYHAEQIQHAVTKVADAIISDLQKTETDATPILVLCVMNGAVPFTAALIQHLPISLQLDYIHASRYGKALSGGQIEWKALPQTPLKDRHILIVDDIYDEGATLKAIIDHCFSQQAKQVSTAVLVDKCHQRKVEGLTIDYVGLQVPDQYVFGFGMDCEGWGRNLPGIYQLKT